MGESMLTFLYITNTNALALSASLIEDKMSIYIFVTKLGSLSQSITFKLGIEILAGGPSPKTNLLMLRAHQRACAWTFLTCIFLSTHA